MTQTKTQIGDVTYNAATQAFEALVTFHIASGRVRVAASYPATIDTSFRTVSDGLWHDAIKHLKSPDALQARLHAKRTQAVRITRPGARLPAWLRLFQGQRQAA